MNRKIDYYITILILTAGLLTFSQCAKEDPIIDSISINQIANDTIYAGKVYQLEVSMTPFVSNPRLSWSISDAHLASIQYGGVLKPISSGELTVYVTSLQSGGKKVRASRTFTVLSSGVYLKDRSIALNPQDSKSLEYVFLPEDFTPSEQMVWTSSDPGIATVDNEGKVTGVQLGHTTIKVKLGNPLSGFYSEDSCLVSVQSFREPTYTYKDEVLTFEQEAPGVLPMYAREMPYFKKMIVKGPINGNDLLFMISKKDKIESLDLGDTYVLAGGQDLVIKPDRWSPEERYHVEDNYVPGAFFEKLEIKNLVVPQNLTSPFSFSSDFLLESLTFPESYDTVSIEKCNINEIHFPSKMKAFLCNVAGMKRDKKVIPYVATFNNPVIFPRSLETLHVIAIFKADLVIPSTVKDLRLSYKFKTLSFESNSTIKFDETLIPVYKKLHQMGDASAMMPLEIEKLVLPDGLTTIGNKAFAANLPHSDELFWDRTIPRGTEPRLINTIIFPSTLKTIEFLAFANCTFGEPIYLPEGLEKIQYSAFFGAKMKEVHIPASIKSIGDQAFAMCPELEDVYMSSSNPPAISSSVFQRTRKMGKMYRLHIPSGTKAAYIEAGYEDSFFEIVEE